MFIQTEATPNPATIKFLPGRDVSPQKNFDFRSPEDAAPSPLALKLFKVPGTQGVFLGGDFISVTKSDDTDWSMLKPLIMAAMMDHIATGQPIIDEKALAVKDASEEAGEDDEITAQIKELLETRVRPAVMMDGGDIVFESFEDGVVFLRMQGACSGCPSSTATLKVGIENMLRHFIPEVEEVRPVGEMMEY